MKILKVLIISITVIALSIIYDKSNGQNFYVNAGLGYGFDAATQDIWYLVGSSTSDKSVTTYTYNNINGSLGKGINFGGNIGYMFNNNFGFEVGINYLSGSKIKYSAINMNVNDSSSTEGYFKSNMIRIIPAIKMCKSFGIITTYMKAGMLIGFNGKIIQQLDIKSLYKAFDPVTISTTEIDKGGTSIGFMGAIGSEYKLSNMISIYCEFGFMSATWAPTKGQITKWTVNSDDQLSLPSTTYNMTNFIFTDSYSETKNVNTSDARQYLKSYYPLSSWGINIGIHIILDKNAGERNNTKIIEQETEAKYQKNKIEQDKQEQIAKGAKRQDIIKEEKARLHKFINDSLAFESFKKQAEQYRALKIKPELSEESRKYIVQATSFIESQNYEEAIKLYKKAIDKDQTYPPAYFNISLLLAEAGKYDDAIWEMKKYLLLVPDATNAKTAQDKINEWELKTKK